MRGIVLPSTILQDSVITGEIPLTSRLRNGILNVQAIGLILITLASFLPRLFHLQEYLFFTMLTVALVTAMLERRSPFARTPIDYPVLGLILWILLTIPFSVDPGYSFSEWRKLVANVLVFYWSLHVFRRHQSDRVWRSVLWAVIIGGLCVGAFALFEFFMRGGTWKDRFIRAEAPYSDYNWLTTYMVLVIPIVISVIVVYRKHLLRTMAWLALPVAIAAQLAAYTRAGWIAHVAQVVTLGLVTRHRRLMLTIAAGLVLVSVLLAVAMQVGFQKETLKPLTFDQRIRTWKLGVQYIVAHPFAGVGYGNDIFRKLHPEYSIEAQTAKPLEEQVLPAMHNTFLMVAMGSGVPAAALLLYVFIKAFHSLLVLRHTLPCHEASGLILGIALVVVGFATRNSFDYMFAGSLATLFWILLATGLSIQIKQPQSV